MIVFACPKCSAPMSAANKLAGKRRHCKACGRSVTIPRVSTPPAPAPAPPPPQDHANEIEQIRRELHAEREARSRLEQQLRDAERALGDAKLRAAAPPPHEPKLAPAHDADKALLDAAALHAPLAAPKSTADRGPLEIWLMEATLRADDDARAASVPALDLIPDFAVTARHAAPDQLELGRRAIEAAEARAAHNAAQVKRLTEELAATRAEQMRTAARLHALEDRLREAESRAAELKSTFDEAPAATTEPFTPPPSAEAEAAEHHFEEPWDVPPPAEAQPSIPESAPAPPPAKEAEGLEDALLGLLGDADPQLSDSSGSSAPASIEVPLFPDEDFQDIAPEAPTAPAQSASLLDALAEWGAVDAALPPAAESTPEAEPAPVEAPAKKAMEVDLAGADLLDVLDAWGAGEGSDAPPKPEPAEPKPVAADSTSGSDLLDVLSAWVPEDQSEPAAPEETPQPDASTEAETGVDLLDVLSSWTPDEESTAAPEETSVQPAKSPEQEAPAPSLDELLDAIEKPPPAETWTPVYSNPLPEETNSMSTEKSIEAITGEPAPDSAVAPEASIDMPVDVSVETDPPAIPEDDAEALAIKPAAPEFQEEASPSEEPVAAEEPEAEVVAQTQPEPEPELPVQEAETTAHDDETVDVEAVPISDAAAQQAPPRKNAISESLQQWGGLGASDERRKAAPRPAIPVEPVDESAKKKPGKAAMLDALMDFMGQR